MTNNLNLISTETESAASYALEVISGIETVMGLYDRLTAGEALTASDLPNFEDFLAATEGIAAIDPDLPLDIGLLALYAQTFVEGEGESGAEVLLPDAVKPGLRLALVPAADFVMVRVSRADETNEAVCAVMTPEVTRYATVFHRNWLEACRTCEKEVRA